MNRQELLKDWYIRYHLVFGKRYTIRQKKRFLKSLSADILPFRQDIKLDTFKLNEKDKNEYQNLYVGNIKKADTIICTYYDTPAVRCSPYHFFDIEHRKKSLTTFILFSSILYIIIGFLFTLLVAIPIFQTKEIGSIWFILCILFYIVYFYFLNKVTRGLPKRNNLIQNTSSILLLLNCIASFHSKRLAFALVDAGCTNDVGLEKLMNESDAKVYMLDSIGSEKPLYQVMPNSNQYREIESVDQVDSLVFTNDRLVYIISGDKKDDQFILSRKDLQKKKLNESNMNNLFSFLEQVERRKFK
ncbi:hypothetical protein [Caldifermentibacillus hisashii]|uniref:hypothetical protein n=1 Tax=Caldifermentibacillus hisashii TaxID=996558 RepID=UPI001C10E6CA|nr:hypothetical protein [Caldifermentibacillus hisashii]MBU5343398.1 hypothetical protein [Caldifermentibacillus hisashii]